jgi:hypothetical protein
MIEYYLRTAFPGELALLRDYVVERALPPLDDLQGKADALERAYADFERLDSFDEPSGVAGTAAAVAAEKYFNQALSLRHTLLGLFTLGLHHLVEQQLARMHALLTNANQVPFDAAAPCAAIEALDVRPRNFRAWPILTELRCVASVVKHAEGDAAAKLRKIRPDLLQHPAIKGQRPEEWLLEQAVQRPLAGDDLYLESRDFERYAAAAAAFWGEMSTAFGVRRP